MNRDERLSPPSPQTSINSELQQQSHLSLVREDSSNVVVATTFPVAGLPDRRSNPTIDPLSTHQTTFEQLEQHVIPHLTNTTINTLIAEFNGGKKEAFDLIFVDYFGYAASKARQKGIEPDTAKDIAQTALIKAHTAIENGKYKQDSNFQAWFTTIISNIVIDHYRKRKQREGEVDLDKVLDAENGTGPNYHIIPKDQEPDPVATLILQQESHTLLSNAITQLPTIQQTVVHARLDGKKLEEIAVENHKTTGTIKNLDFRARRNLRKKLQELQD